MKPLRIAGRTIGSVTVRATRTRPAPRMEAASSRSEAMSSSVLAIMMKTYGKV